MKFIEAKNPAKTTKRLTLIQVFRGIASLLVVGVHGELIFKQNLSEEFLFNIFHFGGSGVDFFFVLSGFIIYYVHQWDFGKSSKVREFAIKRIVRIYPIYWVILTAKLLASVSFSYANINERNWLEVIKAFSLFPQDRGILSESFLGVSWTLSYEIFFYLIFGFLVYFGVKKCFPVIAIWVALVILHLIGIVTVSDNNVLLKFLFSNLHLEFVLGILAAYLLSNYTLAHGDKIMYFGMFLFTLGAINYNYSFQEIPSLILFGIPSTFLVIGAVAWEMQKNTKFPDLLILLGNASYSLYLIHGFIMNNFTKITMKLGLAEAIVQNDLLMTMFGIVNMILATVVGCLVYLYIEKPMISVLRQTVVKKFS